jgi:hypothetical protein
MSKLLEWFLLFVASMPSSHAEDRRLAEDGGEMRMYFRERGGLQGGRASGGRSPLHCYSGGMERRGDGVKRLNLGRSIDDSCKCFQHFWIGIGVVSLCIGFALPQTDCNRILAAGI